MSLALAGKTPGDLESAPAFLNQGCIDFLAYCGKLGGWIACGWIAIGWHDSDAPLTCTLDFSETSMTAEAVMCLFPRHDVQTIGSGFVVFVPGESSHARHDLSEMWLQTGILSFHLTPSHHVERLSEADAVGRAKTLLGGAPRSDRRARLLKLLSRPAYAGQDTLDALPRPVFIETDSATLCPTSSLLIRGWFADPFRQVAALRVRCGTRTADIDRRRWIEIARPDVFESLKPEHGSISERCGFMTFVPDISVPGEICYFEIETATGEFAFKRLPPFRSPGLAAIKECLSIFDLRYRDMVEAFDHVVGPAVAAMNQFRLEERPQVREMVFGIGPADPACSLIVPLYGRIDFMEYQLAFFARTLDPAYELIYVLDDPTMLRAAEMLATSCLARFDRPFRLLTLSRNVGYAPANNIGLAYARAPYVCFLNSDVFPKTPAWLDEMIETAESDPAIGIVGALLLFEDDTVQHEGCACEELPEFGGWLFPLHPNKGRAPALDAGVETVEAVTGACMLLRTDLARDVGGFDEGYVIGDFEDIDLCRKIDGRGLACVVDRRAQLYHLERQSQGAQAMPWRLNLTLYNAWRFQNRWHKGNADLLDAA